MNLIFFRLRKVWPQARPRPIVRVVAFGVTLFVFLSLQAGLRAQTKTDPAAEFKSLAAQLSAARVNGAPEEEAPQEKALRFLDELALRVLNGPAARDLDAANLQLASLVSHTPPVGENYRLVRLGGTPAVYAMIANFGLGGPAAVRIYSGAGGRYALAARIDHFVNKDFLDSDIELVPVSLAEPVFVLVAGRTDDLATGMFSAWRFDGNRAAALWNSDLLQQSSYETDGEGFHLTYCSEPDEDHPALCRKMSHEVYRLQGSEWKRVETRDTVPAKLAPKQVPRSILDLAGSLHIAAEPGYRPQLHR